MGHGGFATNTLICNEPEFGLPSFTFLCGAHELQHVDVIQSCRQLETLVARQAKIVFL